MGANPKNRVALKPRRIEIQRKALGTLTGEVVLPIRHAPLQTARFQYGMEIEHEDI